MTHSQQDRAAEILREIVNPVESVVNLLYLIEHDRNNPDAVLRYVRMADEPVRCIAELVQAESQLLSEQRQP